MNREIEKEYWENKILRWEKLRYSSFAYFYPLSWGLRRRLSSSVDCLQKMTKGCEVIIELGCGSGVLTSKIQDKYKSYVGYDVATCAIEEARKRNLKNAEFIASNVSDLQSLKCDVLIFLGLIDWIQLTGLGLILDRTNAKNIICSFTNTPLSKGHLIYSSYRKIIDSKIVKNNYGAKSYSIHEIEKYFSNYGYKITIVKKPSFFDPGVVVWATK